MVFVTVGNAREGFRRLLDAVEDLCRAGFFGDEEVLAQFGHADGFTPRSCRGVAFLQPDAFGDAIRDASLVISHAGAGTLLHVLRSGKTPVVMPRRAQYDEHIDDHQVELVTQLAREGRVVPAFEPAELPRAVSDARSRDRGRRVAGSPSRMASLVAEALATIFHEKPE